MNETELLLVGFALVSLSSLSWILGVLVGGRVQRRLSTPRHSDEDDEGDGPDLSVRRVRLEPATDPDRWTAEDGYVDLREDRGRGTDDEDVVDTLERVRSSDER